MEKVALTLWFELIVTWHEPVPEQAPLHPPNVEPWFAIAVSCTAVPLLKLALHVAPQFMPAGELVTIPLPEPELFTESVKAMILKVAVTDWAEFIVTWQDPVPEQAPLHPANVKPVFAAAVNCTTVPPLKLALQVVPQPIPLGLLVTMPVPVPASITERVTPIRLKVAVTD